MGFPFVRWGVLLGMLPITMWFLMVKGTKMLVNLYLVVRLVAFQSKRSLSLLLRFLGISLKEKRIINKWIMTN